jgi:HD-like signal output (HDOD) protein
LLHDFGKVVFAQYMPDQFREALLMSQRDGSSLHKALQVTIGVDHTVVGAMLVQKWNFAPHLIETIANQHGDKLTDTAMIACVFAANQISKKMNYGFGGNACIEALPEAMIQRLGGDLAAVITKLGDLRPLFEEAKVFSRLEGPA